MVQESWVYPKVMEICNAGLNQQLFGDVMCIYVKY